MTQQFFIIDFIADVSVRTGILCDRVYVGKALREVVYLLNNQPQRFKGNKILFIHTGKFLPDRPKLIRMKLSG